MEAWPSHLYFFHLPSMHVTHLKLQMTLENLKQSLSAKFGFPSVRLQQQMEKPLGTESWEF